MSCREITFFGLYSEDKYAGIAEASPGMHSGTVHDVLISCNGDIRGADAAPRPVLELAAWPLPAGRITN